MEKNSAIQETMDTLLNGMDGFMTTKTVVGEPINIGETIIVPLVNVSFGIAAGAFKGEKKLNSGGGMGGRLTPTAVLVIHNGVTRMISVDSNSSIDKILDMIPDFVEKFKCYAEGKHQDKAARAAAAEELNSTLEEALSKTNVEE